MITYWIVTKNQIDRFNFTGCCMALQLPSTLVSLYTTVNNTFETLRTVCIFFLRRRFIYHKKINQQKLYTYVQEVEEKT